MMGTNINWKNTGLYSMLLITGLLLGYLLFAGSSPQQEQAHDHGQQLETIDGDQEEVWTCPMHPQVRENEPGDCPICGMELVRADEVDEDAEVDDYSMVMSERAVNMARVRTTEVIEEVPTREIDLPGRIRVDERRISHVTADFPGRIRNLMVDFTGARINRGEPMVEIYSPEVVSAQRELLQAHRNQRDNPAMLESARQKLRQWEFSDAQIDRILERGEVIRDMEVESPVDGYVLERNVAREEHVGEGTIMYKVVDLDHLWVTLEAYEEDLQWLSTGDPITFRSRSYPGETFEAEISYIDPDVDPRSRTVGVRADFSNAEGRLKPDMLVEGRVSSEDVMGPQLMVPASAVLWTGPRSVVYIQDTDSEMPRFEAREVELGPRAGDYYVIHDGVDTGEQVVYHGNFRLDSEMQLQDRFSMMNREPGTGPSPGHDHGGMDDHEDMEEQQMEDHEHDEEMQEHDGPLEGVSEDFRREFRELLDHYLEGYFAFFESEDQAAVEAFERFAGQLEAIGEHRMDGDAHMQWMQDYEALSEQIEALLDAGDIDERRDRFAGLSGVLIEALRHYGMDDELHVQYCPMEDAEWLSSEEQIRNPFMPEDMPGCGEVSETLDGT